MIILQQISNFWFQYLPILPEDYWRWMQWQFFPIWTMEHYFMSVLAAFLSGSGLLISETKWFFDVLIISAILALLIDTLTLSLISSKNQKFLKNHSEKIPQNKKFIIFFILWRIFLPDIFIASSLAARYFRINLSKKHIFLLSLLVQVIRISLLAMIYFVFI